MLCLSKKTEYALIALGYLAERPGQLASAREIASGFNLPPALLMNILKVLNRNRLLESTRGIHGGYRIGAAWLDASLHDLIAILDGDDSAAGLIEVHQDAQGIEHRPLSAHAAVDTLNQRLIRFLKDVKLVDLVNPSHSIDSSLEAMLVKAS